MRSITPHRLDPRLPVVAALLAFAVVGVPGTAAAAPAATTVRLVPVGLTDHLCGSWVTASICVGGKAAHAANEAAHTAKDTADAAGKLAGAANDLADTTAKTGGTLGQGLSDAAGVINNGLDRYDQAKAKAKQAVDAARERAEARQSRPIIVPPGGVIVVHRPDGSSYTLRPAR